MAKGSGPRDPSIVETAEDRTRALGGDPAQNAAADGLQAGLEAKRAKNAEAATTPELTPEPSTSPSLGEAPPAEASQRPSEPAQPPQAAVAVAEAPTVHPEQPAPGTALGLDAAPQTITSAGVVEAPVKAEPISATVRKFACAKQPNGRFLVRAGKVMQVVDPNSPSGLKAFQRNGDKFVKFIGGVSEEIQDLEVIAFCERHQDIYDVNDPESALRYDLENIQQPKAVSDPIALPSLNIEAAIKGESPDGGLTGDSPIGAARRQVQEANERV